MNRATVAIAKRLNDNEGIIDENKNRDGSKKYGKNGILYEKKYCRKIMKTYDGMHTPRIETTVQTPSKNFPRCSAAVIPRNNPTIVPKKIDSTPILNEFSRQASNIGLIGAPLYKDVPFPKLPLNNSDM